MARWITLPAEHGYGEHKVAIPPGFKKLPKDFATREDFLAALRKYQERKAQPLVFQKY